VDTLGAPLIDRIENRPLGVPPTGVDGEVLGIGSSLGLTVIFDQAVLIDTGAGTLKLTLNNGVELFYSGSPLPGNSVTFPYTIAEDDGDVDPVDVVSLVASAADVIENAAGADADTTLPGGTSDLFNQGIGIDSTRPTVDNVTSDKSDVAPIAYRVGELIDIDVFFDEPIFLVGTAQLALKTGDASETTSVSLGGTQGINGITGDYTVLASDNSDDLDYVATGSLTLTSTIKDAAGNDADLTLPSPGATGSLFANKDLIIDNESPTVGLEIRESDGSELSPDGTTTRAVQIRTTCDDRFTEGGTTFSGSGCATVELDGDIDDISPDPVTQDDGTLGTTNTAETLQSVRGSKLVTGASLDNAANGANANDSTQLDQM